jgi:hypothetical protein
MEYSIADDYDADGDISANTSPMTEYLSYVSHVHAGAVGDMGFTLENFKRYIAGLRKGPITPNWV